MVHDCVCTGNPPLRRVEGRASCRCREHYEHIHTDIDQFPSVSRQLSVFHDPTDPNSPEENMDWDISIIPGENERVGKFLMMRAQESHNGLLYTKQVGIHELMQSFNQQSSCWAPGGGWHVYFNQLKLCAAQGEVTVQCTGTFLARRVLKLEFSRAWTGSDGSDYYMCFDFELDASNNHLHDMNKWIAHLMRRQGAHIQQAPPIASPVHQVQYPEEQDLEMPSPSTVATFNIPPRPIGVRQQRQLNRRGSCGIVPDDADSD